ncbi:MAG: glycine cleavage system aminomethyltransferase GcvT [Limnochordales bacterium]|nr:glycine cleavage system protein T [Bacillota bacterium]REJ33964.1 MAG: glycine cleavage system aminomethyltransferase GcvT [Bacillota bacterium]
MSDHGPAGKRTPLYEEHLASGARMIDFAGFRMPVEYSGILEEHRAVRSAAGLFDLSHMGEIKVGGPGAAAFLDWAMTNRIADMEPGQARYSLMCKPDGGIVDDVVVYRRDGDFLVVVNAANIAKDFQWLDYLRRAWPGEGGSPVRPEDVILEDLSDATALLAVQGPRSLEILTRLTDAPLAAVAPFRFIEGKVDGYPALISRTGYTGEDGFELYVAPEAAVPLWRALLLAGKDLGLVPVGLGARDTLRLEMRFPLYGNDIDESTTPLEAGLGFAVKLDKDAFVGKEALVRQAAQGVARRLVGFRMIGRGIPRQGYPLLAGDREVGRVTSGTMSPTLGEPIGMGYVAAEYASPGQELAVEIRGRSIPCQVVKGRFVRPAR